MSSCRYEVWAVVRTLYVSEKSLYSVYSDIFSQYRERSMGEIWLDLGALTAARQHMHILYQYFRWLLKVLHGTVYTVQNPAIADIYTEHSVQTTVAKYSPSGFYIASAGDCVTLSYCICYIYCLSNTYCCLFLHNVVLVLYFLIRNNFCTMKMFFVCFSMYHMHW